MFTYSVASSSTLTRMTKDVAQLKLSKWSNYNRKGELKIIIDKAALAINDRLYAVPQYNFAKSSALFVQVLCRDSHQPQGNTAV